MSSGYLKNLNFDIIKKSKNYLFFNTFHVHEENAIPTKHQNVILLA